MGISTHIFRAILREHKRRPILGKGLLIGRQSVFFNLDTAKSIGLSEHVPLLDIQSEGDHETRSGGELLDYDLFRSFSDIHIDALDVTNYENANIIHDMHKPVPAELYDQYDFIYDGSCMDNLFNPAEFLKNCSRMLKPGGRLIAIEHGSAFPGGYLLYSPDYFLDFFALNNYLDTLVFVCDFVGHRSPHHIQSPWMLWNWNPLRNGRVIEHSSHPSHLNRLNLIIAEKGDLSTDERIPIQGQYRTNEGLNEPTYQEACERFLNSTRLDYYRTTNSIDWANTPGLSNLEFIGIL